MFILFVFLVSMNLLMIRTDENIIRIDIKAGGQQKICDVLPEVKVVEGNNFTLQVRSDYFIKYSLWEQHRSGFPQRKRNLRDLPDSKFGITYERNIPTAGERNNTFVYTYSHTQKADSNSGGTWILTFNLLTGYDPFTDLSLDEYRSQNWSCNTSVQIDPSFATRRSFPRDKTPVYDTSASGGGVNLLIVLVSVFGILLLLQSSFILYVKIRSSKSNRNDDEDPISPKSPKAKHGTKNRRNIADRPPLPLPPEEIVKEEPMSPPMSPVPKRHHIFPPPTAPPMPVENSYGRTSGSIVPKQSYRNEGFNTSEQGVKSPEFSRRQMEGPLVSKPSFRNTPLVNSEEELRSPHFARRQLEGPLMRKQSIRHHDEKLRSPVFSRRQESLDIGPLVSKPSFRNTALVNSEEELRTPHFARRQLEGPVVSNPSFRNTPLVNSEEELMTPTFARRQLEATLAQLPPKGVPASKTFKLPKPLPRSPPSPTPEKAPTFHPAQRKESLPRSPPSPPPEKTLAFHPAQRKGPAPPLHPKKLPVIPPSAPCRQPDLRMSDDEWQYEQLQPTSNYLNNCSNTPYDNM